MLTAKNISYTANHVAGYEVNRQIISVICDDGDIHQTHLLREIVNGRNPLSSWTLGALDFEKW